MTWAEKIAKKAGIAAPIVDVILMPAEIITAPSVEECEAPHKTDKSNNSNPDQPHGDDEEPR